MDVDKYQTKFSRVSPSEQQENNTPDNSKPNHLQRWHHSSRIIRVSRASGGKDRHSKVWTSKGLRDRRVRLSVTTAIQFYDLQDRLGFDQPSKAVEWLIKAAADSIAELPSLNDNFPPDQCQNSNSDTSKGSNLSISRENARVKARERARERTLKEREREREKEKDKEKESDGNYIYNDSSSFTELLTGGFKGGEEGKSWALTPMDYNVSSSKTSQFFNHQLPFGDSSHCGGENLPQFPFADPIIGADYNLNFTISPTHGGLNRGTLQSNSHHQSLRNHFQRLNANSSSFSSPPVDAAGNFFPFFLGSPAPEHQFSSPAFHFLYGDGNKGKGKN